MIRQAEQEACPVSTRKTFDWQSRRELGCCPWSWRRCGVCSLKIAIKQVATFFRTLKAVVQARREASGFLILSTTRGRCKIAIIQSTPASPFSCQLVEKVRLFLTASWLAIIMSRHVDSQTSYINSSAWLWLRV